MCLFVCVFVRFAGNILHSRKRPSMWCIGFARPHTSISERATWECTYHLSCASDSWHTVLHSWVFSCDSVFLVISLSLQACVCQDLPREWSHQWYRVERLLQLACIPAGRTTSQVWWHRLLKEQPTGKSQQLSCTFHTAFELCYCSICHVFLIVVHLRKTLMLHM